MESERPPPLGFRNKEHPEEPFPNRITGRRWRKYREHTASCVSLAQTGPAGSAALSSAGKKPVSLGLIHTSSDFAANILFLITLFQHYTK